VLAIVAGQQGSAAGHPQVLVTCFLGALTAGVKLKVLPFPSSLSAQISLVFADEAPGLRLLLPDL